MFITNDMYFHFVIIMCCQGLPTCIYSVGLLPLWSGSSLIFSVTFSCRKVALKWPFYVLHGGIGCLWAGFEPIAGSWDISRLMGYQEDYQYIKGAIGMSGKGTISMSKGDTVISMKAIILL